METKKQSLLKDPAAYNPDTFDLKKDVDARAYWFAAIEQLVENFVEKSECLNPGDATAKNRATQCLHLFRSSLKQIRQNVPPNNELSIRLLLEINEACLREANFKDAWKARKSMENKTALKLFEDRLIGVDLIKSFDDKWFNLIRGMIAGNMFDWGSKDIIDIFASNSKFNFENAIDEIQSRPWLVDHFDSWLTKIKKSYYKCVICFPDNSGYDILLGVLPIVREFLRSGTKVIISSNSKPSINDITNEELVDIIEIVKQKCHIFSKAIDENRLILLESGSCSPCLDFRQLNPKISDFVDEIDLVLIEGMGRAIHTNFYCQFSVDSLKLAVIKNDWIAERLGGKKFDVICKYEKKALH